MRLETSDSLKGFFYECLSKAQKNQNIELQEVTQVYLLGLLEKALSTKSLFASKDTQEIDEPLALLLGRALSSETLSQKLELLKQIGDRSLFVSGFFSDSFIRKMIDIDYYISMGGQAYRFASDLVEEKSSGRYRNLFPEAFSELSIKFKSLVDIMSEISERAGLTQDKDVLRIYERWVHTKSGRLADKLKERGIITVESNYKNWSN